MGDVWLTIVPVEASRSSYNGLLVFAFITASMLLTVVVVHRLASRAVRRTPAWDCGFPDPTPASQYTAVSFAQPMRRVFGTVVFRSSETVDMPAPGDNRPASIVRHISDPIWDSIYAPLGRGVGWVADHRQLSAIPDDKALSGLRLRRPGRAAAGADTMAMIQSLLAQLVQMTVILLLSPLLTGAGAQGQSPACNAAAARR